MLIFYIQVCWSVACLEESDESATVWVHVRVTIPEKVLFGNILDPTEEAGSVICECDNHCYLEEKHKINGQIRLKGNSGKS